MDVCDVCQVKLRRRAATVADPYHYTLSGLPNVLLVGIPVSTCPRGHGESPEIPRLAGLHRAIASMLIQKPHLLDGNEVRFLRKFAALPSGELAKRLGETPSHLSRVENGTRTLGPAADALVRLLAADVLDAREQLVRDTLNRPKGRVRAQWKCAFRPRGTRWDGEVVAA